MGLFGRRKEEKGPGAEVQVKSLKEEMDAELKGISKINNENRVHETMDIVLPEGEDSSNITPNNLESTIKNLNQDEDLEEETIALDEVDEEVLQEEFKKAFGTSPYEVKEDSNEDVSTALEEDNNEVDEEGEPTLNSLNNEIRESSTEEEIDNLPEEHLEDVFKNEEEPSVDNLVKSIDEQVITALKENVPEKGTEEVKQYKYAFQKNLNHKKVKRTEVKLNTHIYSEEELEAKKLKALEAADRKALRESNIPNAQDVKKRVYLRDARVHAAENDRKVEEAKERRKAAREVKVESNGQKLAKERIQRAIKTPFTYYYDCCRDKDNNNLFCNISQCMNDKFAGRIYEPQYFAIAEESDRIFTINYLLLEQAVGQAQLWPEEIFAVQLSSRYLEKGERYQELRNILEAAPKNIIYCFECRPLVLTGERGRERLKELRNDFGIKILIDTPETERLSLLFDYPMDMIRLDGRYYRDRQVSKMKFVKLLSTYCKVDDITLCAQYVDTPEDKNWLSKYGVKYLEGQAIEPIKATVKTALNAGPVKLNRFAKKNEDLGANN